MNLPSNTKKRHSRSVITEAKKSDGQKAAEVDVENFRKELGPFVVAAETTRMAVIFTDAKAPGHPIVFANDAFLSLTGYRREEVLAQSITFLMAGEANQAELAEVETSFLYRHDPDAEICFRRKDGSALWAALYVSPVCDERGDVVQHFVSLADLTRHRREENRLRFLLDELNHRTQNMLATVQAIAGQTLQGRADAQVVDDFEHRILAMADAHALLGRENWDRLSLQDVIRRVLHPFGLNNQKTSRFSVTGDDVHVQPKAALTLAMVFHELATNAVKYGALSGRDGGQIDLAWHIESTEKGERVRLRWHESGGPQVTPPSRQGFGSRLIQLGLARDLNGEARLDFLPAGVVCDIAVPLPAGDGG